MAIWHLWPVGPQHLVNTAGHLTVCERCDTFGKSLGDYEI
jgi:hypothetical protein